MRNIIGIGIGLVVAVLSLTACDNGPSVVAKTDGADKAAAQAPPKSRSSANQETAAASSGESLPASLNGKPLWSSTRTYTASANAERAFRQNGEAFGAKDAMAYVRAAHTFISKPPRGTLTYKRPNGDQLMYDPKANSFAVVTKDGAPRTLFKPREGRAYWDEQMTTEKGKGG